MTSLDFDSLGQAPDYCLPDYDSLCKSDVYVARYRPSNEPTVAQLKAGNYPKRQIPWHGMTISEENAPGTFRRGIDPNGNPRRQEQYPQYVCVTSSLLPDID